ncbi:MAG: asparagine synthase (glutamine-hydrolyzing) [Hyphomicrobiales bacterium]
MCGLFASIGFAPDPERLDIVAHRGPDGRGWRVFDSPSGPVVLGQRRLAIIDTSDGGRQPMSDAGERFHLITNGEIYNYLELRAELQAQGEVFRTDSDTEVLLRAYMIWGEAGLERLRGMFAFILWDVEKRTLFAARDRFGIKPLYFVIGPRGLALASEIKQLLGLAGAERRMNLGRVHDFLASGMSDHTDETMFGGVMQLRGGECLRLEAQADGSLLPSIRRWYRIPEYGGASLGEDEAGSRFKELLQESVRLHLRSDVPVGSCLSGGLDSSSIVCLVSDLLDSRRGGPKLNTVSACYREKAVDEKEFMDLVVAEAAVSPHFVFPRAEDVFQRASDIVWHQDEPFGSTSIFAQWCVFEEARRVGVKVMLDGQGADEQLAGYHPGYSYHLAGLLTHGRFGAFAQTLRERNAQHGAPILGESLRALLPLLPEGFSTYVLRQRQLLLGRNWLGSDFIRANGHRGALGLATGRLGLPPVADIATLCLAMTFTSNLPMLLHWEDRSSMAHSIEARVPFLDHPLVEFSLALGNDHKMQGAETKSVLRRAMSGVLPDAVRDRRDKLGFATPEESWFRGPLRRPVEDGVEATLKRYPDLFDAAGTRALARDMLDGRRPFDFKLWRIVSLGLWGERFEVTV